LRVVWTPGETIALAAATTALALATIVWAATQVAVFAADRPTRSVHARRRRHNHRPLLLHPTDPLAALPAGVPVDSPAGW
jgi:hypothetical protein